MALDTLAKRSAALRFGRGSTTRPPQGASSEFSRGAGLGCYIPVVTVITPPNFTKRLTLIGASAERLTLEGVTTRRLSLTGASTEILDLQGSSI